MNTLSYHRFLLFCTSNCDSLKLFPLAGLTDIFI